MKKSYLNFYDPIIGILCTFCVILACKDASAESIPESAYVSDLKAFLNTNLDNYEIVFSVVTHENEYMRRKLAEFNKQGSAKLEVAFEKPAYFHLRRTGEGYLLHNSFERSDLDDFKVSVPKSSARGVFSNSFWSIGNNNLVEDSGYLPEYESKNPGATWKQMADEDERQILSLGLWIQNGSLVWTGNDFTAETKHCSPVPRDKRGQRIASGTIKVSDNIPVAIHCEMVSNQFDIYLRNEKQLECGFKIPCTFDVVRSYPGGSQSNTYEIMSLKLPPSSSAAINSSLFINANNPTLTVLTKGPNGKGAAVQIQGLPLKRPVPVGFSAARGVERSRSRYVLGTITLISFIFILYIVKRKRST